MRFFKTQQPGFTTLLLTRFLALTALAVLAVAMFGARALGERLRADNEEHLREAALRVSDAVEAYLRAHQQAIDVITLHVRPGEEHWRTLELLEQMEKIYPGFRTLMVTDVNGRILVDRPRRREAGPGPQDVGDRDYFQAPKHTGQPYISGIFESRRPGEGPVVAIGAPLLDNHGKFAGVVAGLLDISKLPMAPDATFEKMTVVVSDREGRVVFSSRPEIHHQMEIWKPYALDEVSSVGTFYVADPAQRDADGNVIPQFTIRFPIERANWQVASSMPSDQMRREASVFYAGAAGLFLAVLLVAWVLTQILARRIARPIVALAKAMQEYRLEGVEPPPPMEHGVAREIVRIQSEFQLMGTRLRESYRQLQEMMRGLDRKVAERTAELAESESRYRQVIETSPVLIFNTDVFGEITFHNPSFALHACGDASADCRGRQFFEFLTPEWRDAVRASALQQLRERSANGYIEYPLPGAGGAVHWFGQNTQLVLDDERRPLGFQAIARDVTEARLAAQALREAEERFSLAVRGSNNGIWDWDLRSGKIYFSSRWKQMFGLRPNEPCDTPEAWFSRVHAEDAPGLRSLLNGFIEMGHDQFDTEVRMKHADGTWRWILISGAAVRGTGGRALRVAGSKTDITTGKLADPLTGLPNRLYLLDLLEAWIWRLREDPTRKFALLFLDLDRFKLVNDSLGHVKGDHLLLGVSMRLTAALQTVPKADGTVVRLGGDEFVIALDTTHHPDAPEQLAAAVLRLMESPFHLDGSLVFVSTSIGIACSDSSSGSAESLLRDADTAMYHAKAAGRGRFAVFDASMHARAVARLELETDLRNALERKEFELFFQPQADLRTGRLSGFEALVRWRHPSRGLLLPGEFIPVAEENGLILPLGLWVLEESCRKLADWDRKYTFMRDVSMSVNLSARQFTDPSLAGEVLRVLKETGLKPARVHLEVTESMLADDPKMAQETLKQLSTMGVALEVDDFGTGYSCLGQLNQLPFDTLKIDRSFVQALDQERDGHKMIDSIVRLADSLDISVVAEGIETADHWAYIASLGCRSGQGYYFSRPLNEEAALALAADKFEHPWAVPAPQNSSLAGLMGFTGAARNTPRPITK